MTNLTISMQFEKRPYMGIELDILTGHPDHELLFVATQVARAVGLKHPAIAVRDYRKTKAGADAGGTLMSVMGNLPIKEIPKDPAGRRFKDVTVLFTESEVNRMLMRGSTAKAYEFQTWLAEDVVPAIRKTGKYNAEESTNPIAQGVMDELKTLRGEVGELKSLIEILMARPLLVSESAPASVSTYLCPEVHTEFVWRHFDRKLLIRLCDMQKLSVPVADKLKAAVMVKLEVALLDLWNSKDARKLQTELSGSTKRPWARFPLDFLKKHMNQDAYLSALEKALNEYLLK